MNQFKPQKKIAEAIEEGDKQNQTPFHKENSNFNLNGIEYHRKKRNVKQRYQFSLHEDAREIIEREYKKRGYPSASAMIEAIAYSLEDNKG